MAALAQAARRSSKSDAADAQQVALEAARNESPKRTAERAGASAGKGAARYHEGGVGIEGDSDDDADDNAPRYEAPQTATARFDDDGDVPTGAEATEETELLMAARAALVPAHMAERLRKRGLSVTRTTSWVGEREASNLVYEQHVSLTRALEEVPRLPGFANGWTIHFDDNTYLKHVKRGAKRSTGQIPNGPEWSGESAEQAAEHARQALLAHESRTRAEGLMLQTHVGAQSAAEVAAALALQQQLKVSEEAGAAVAAAAEEQRREAEAKYEELAQRMKKESVAAESQRAWLAGALEQRESELGRLQADVDTGALVPAPLPMEKPESLAGTLFKKSPKRYGLYQLRSVAVREEALAYVTGKGEVRSVGIGEITTLVLKSPERYEFTISTSNGREYHFRAHSTKALSYWMLGLQKHMDYEAHQRRQRGGADAPIRAAVQAVQMTAEARAVSLEKKGRHGAANAVRVAGLQRAATIPGGSGALHIDSQSQLKPLTDVSSASLKKPTGGSMVTMPDKSHQSQFANQIRNASYGEVFGKSEAGVPLSKKDLSKSMPILSKKRNQSITQLPGSQRDLTGPGALNKQTQLHGSLANILQDVEGTMFGGMGKAERLRVELSRGSEGFGISMDEHGVVRSVSGLAMGSGVHVGDRVVQVGETPIKQGEGGKRVAELLKQRVQKLAEASDIRVALDIERPERKPPPPPAPLQGSLFKKSPRGPVYQERTVCLQDGVLAYVTGKREVRSVGVKEVSEVGLTSAGKLEFCVDMASGRKYLFRAHSADAIAYWIIGIKEHMDYEKWRVSGKLRDNLQDVARMRTAVSAFQSGSPGSSAAPPP